MGCVDVECMRMCMGALVCEDVCLCVCVGEGVYGYGGMCLGGRMGD